MVLLSGGSNGSRSTRRRSVSTASSVGCMRRLTPNRSSCLMSRCSAVARKKILAGKRELRSRHRRGTDPASAFLHRLRQNPDLSEAVVLVDGFGYLTALSRVGLSGRLDYSERNLIENWSQTLAMRTDRFHTYWRGSRTSARGWLRCFAHHYNFLRPNQALENRTPVEEVSYRHCRRGRYIFDNLIKSRGTICG